MAQIPELVRHSRSNRNSCSEQNFNESLHFFFPASLTAASAAPSQQQLAVGSGVRGSRQRVSAGGSLQQQHGGSPGFGGFWSASPSVGGAYLGLSPFWFGHVNGAAGNGLGGAPSSSPSLSSQGVAGSHFGSSQGQLPSTGNYAPGSYPGAWNQNYYVPGQYYYGQGPVNGNGASWGVFPGQWGFANNGYGNAYGYGGSYGPAYQVGLGYGGPSFGSLQGSSGFGQVPNAVGGARRSASSSSSSRSQSPVRRQ